MRERDWEGGREVLRNKAETLLVTAPEEWAGGREGGSETGRVW